MKQEVVIGIDPGGNGAIVSLREGKIDRVMKYEKGEDAVVQLIGHLAASHCVCYLERVWGIGHDGAGGSFKFGRSYGFVRGVLLAYRVPIVDVLPKVWMAGINLEPSEKGQKAKHRQAMVRRAHELQDEVTPTNVTAAAILIAFYGLKQEEM